MVCHTSAWNVDLWAASAYTWLEAHYLDKAANSHRQSTGWKRQSLFLSPKLWHRWWESKRQQSTSLHTRLRAACPSEAQGCSHPFTPYTIRGHHCRPPLGHVAILAELCQEILSIAAEKWKHPLFTFEHWESIQGIEFHSCVKNPPGMVLYWTTTFF